MVFCNWASVEPQPVLEQEKKVPEEEDEFDAILAVRTRTSWEQNDGDFENGNEVIPSNSSVEYPEDFTEDEESEYQMEAPMKPADTTQVESVLFPWPFNAPEIATEQRDDLQEFREDSTPDSTYEPKLESESKSEEKMKTEYAENVKADESVVQKADETEKVKAGVLGVKTVLSGYIKQSESGEGLEVPFDELIPSSDGIHVPFDECPLPKSVSSESIQSETLEEEEDAIAMAYISDDEASTVEESGNFMLPTIKEGRSLESNGNRYECLEGTDEEAAPPDQDDTAVEMTPEERALMLIENARVDDSLNKMIKELKSNSPKEDTEVEMTPEERALMLIENARAEISIDSLVMDLESIAHRLDTLSDNIHECSTMDSGHSNLQKVHSTDCTESLLRTLSSVEKEHEERNSAPSPGTIKVIHPPSIHEKNTKITRTFENLDDASFDDVQELRVLESTNSILKGAPSTTSANEEALSIAPSSSILKTTTSRDDETFASSKRVTFSETVDERCPSDQESELAFDYENYIFEDDKIAYDDLGNPYRRSVKDSYDFTDDGTYGDDDTVDGPKPWYKMLVQAK